MLKLLFIPCHENNFLPCLLESGRAWFYSSLLLSVKFVVLLAVVALPMEAFTQQDELRAQEQRVIEMTNELRKDYGVRPLLSNSLLNESARARTQDMLENSYFSHEYDERDTLFFINETGYSPRVVGENLAIGLLTAQSVMKEWMKSDLHIQNILDPDFHDTGIWFERGTFQDKPVIVASHHFASGAIFSMDSVAETTRLHIDHTNSWVDWQNNDDGSITMLARAVISGEVQTASIHAGNYEISLTRNHDMLTLYEGQLIIRENQETFFSLVTSPWLEITTFDGKRLLEPVAWKRLELKPTDISDKYLAAQSLVNPAIRQLFNYSRGVYALFFLVFVVAFVANLALEKRTYHRHVHLRTVAVLLLIIGLYFL